MNASVRLAESLDDAAADAVRRRDFARADELWMVADWLAEPSDGTLVARLLLLSAALARQTLEVAR